MNAVLDRIRARAGAVLPAAPPDESMIVDAGAGRGTHVVVPDDLGDLEALIIGGPQDAPGDVTADAGADELLVLPQTGGGEVDDDEEDGTGGMRLFGRAPPAGLQLRMDDTQGDGDELAAMEEEEDPMAGEAAEAAAAEDALVSETESDTDEDEEDADGDDVAPDADGDELPPPPQEALLTEEERLAQRAAVRAAAMQLLEEEKALRAAERSKAKAMAAAAAAAGGGGEKLGFMEDEAEMSEDGGHTDDDDASDTDDDLAELEAMLAAAEEGGDAEAADTIRAKIHAEWEQAADDRAVAGVVRAMQTGWRRRRGRRLRGEDGDVDDDDPRGPRRRRRGEAGGDGDSDDDLDVRNPFLQSGDGVFDDDLMTQANLRGPPALGRGAPAPGSFMSLLAADDPSRAVLGLLRRRPMAPPLDKPTSGDAMDARGGGGSFFSRGGLPEGASLPQLPPRRGPDGGSNRAFVFARGDDSQGPRDAAGDAAHTDTPQVGVRGAKAAARAAAAAAATAKAGGGLRPAVSAGGTSLLGMLRSYSQSDSQATGDVGENLASNLRKAQGIRMD